jgi:Tfp pilus assembly protein FimT
MHAANTTNVRSDAGRSAHTRRTAGMSLIEVVVVIGIIGALLAVTMPSMDKWFSNQTVKDAARSVSDILLLARSEAVRTGNPHVVFFGVDPDGTTMFDANGGFAPMVAFNDGAAATANCRLDGGEVSEYIEAGDGVTWGTENATTKVSSDTGGASLPPDDSSGSTFSEPPNTTNRVDWIMFRADGIPIAFKGDTDCGTIGVAGKGGGAIYINNGKRDYAIVISPLGGVRVHVWQIESDSWSS